MKWLFNKVEAQPQGQRSGEFVFWGPGFRAGFIENEGLKKWVEYTWQGRES